MSLWKIAWRSIQQRTLASSLTAFSIGLGVALVVAVLVIHSVIDQSFRRGSQGYDLIVGAKGDRLQLVLNTVFHLSQPTDNIPYSYYTRLAQEDFSAAVELAIPVCTGHDYKGFPVIATVPEMFDELTYMDGRNYEFAEGRNFLVENEFEAVVGSVAARELGIEVGDTFTPVAAAQTAEGAPVHEDEAFTIVGILKHTGTPNDRVLFTNMEGFFRCPSHSQGETFAERLLGGTGHKQEDEPEPDAAESEDAHDDEDAHDHESGDEGHAHDDDNGEHAHGDEGEHAHEEGEEGHDHSHDHDEREITAVLVRTDHSSDLRMALPDVINSQPDTQAVFPAKIITELFDGIVGNVQLILLVLAVLVVVVAGIGIMVSIYNSMSDRRHEIAIMRALGASRLTVMAVILVESILLSLGGGVMGLLLGHGLIGILGPTIADQTGVLVSAFEFQWIEVILVPGLIVLATLVGYLPALSAYRTDVAKALTIAP